MCVWSVNRARVLTSSPEAGTCSSRALFPPAEMKRAVIKVMSDGKTLSI